MSKAGKEKMGIKKMSKDILLIRGSKFSVGVRRATGQVVSLSPNGLGLNLLTEPVRISVRDETDGQEHVLSGLPSVWMEEKVAAGVSHVSFFQDIPAVDLRVDMVFECGEDLTWRVRLINRTSRRREMTVTFEFPGLSRGCQVFLPSALPHPNWVKYPRKYGYRTDETTFRSYFPSQTVGLVIPSVTVYRREKPFGLTVMSPFDIPVQGFEVSLDSISHSLKIRRPSLRLEPDSGTETLLLAGFHEPDWRPGLGYILKKFPDFFEVEGSPAPGWNGSFLNTPPPPRDEMIARWRDEGVRWVEVHFTYPFLGRYVPTEDPWTPVLDENWHWEKHKPGAPGHEAPLKDVESYLRACLSRRETVENIRCFIRKLHNHDMKGLLYFNPTEVWDIFARAHFADDIQRNADGSLNPAWREQLVMNPEPESLWGREILRQLPALLDLFPEADGIWMDQCYYDLLDYAHDDGFSICRGRTASRLSYTIYRITECLCRIARERGKVVWWNGPYQVEMARHAEGLLSEGNDMQIQYLAIANKPVTSCACDVGNYARMLVAGFQPMAPSQLVVQTGGWNYFLLNVTDEELRIPAHVLEDFNRFQPLFEEVRERTWVLSPEPLTVPEGVMANIFRTAEGNYAVVIVTPGREGRGDFDMNLPVSVLLPDIKEIRGVYALSADYPGWYRLSWGIKSNCLKVTIPRHCVATLLLLAKRGIFLAMDGGMTRVKGEPAPQRLIAENLNDVRETVCFKVNGCEDKMDLAPGTSAELALPSMSEGGDKSRESAFEMELDNKGIIHRCQQAITVVEPIEITWEGEADGVVGQSKRLKVIIINNSSDARNVKLRVCGDGLHCDGLPETVTVAAKAAQSLKCNVRLNTPGLHNLRLEASYGHGSDTQTVPVGVAAVDFLPGEVIRRGWVQMDIFSPDVDTDIRAGSRAVPAKASGRTVLVNGEKVGAIPSFGRHIWKSRVHIIIPRPIVLVMERSVDIEVRPADSNDFFKIRNICVGLDSSKEHRFYHYEPQSDAPIVFSERIEQIFSTCAGPHAEGKIGVPIELHLRFPK